MSAKSNLSGAEFFRKYSDLIVELNEAPSILQKIKTTARKLDPTISSRLANRASELTFEPNKNFKNAKRFFRLSRGENPFEMDWIDKYMKVYDENAKTPEGVKRNIEISKVLQSFTYQNNSLARDNELAAGYKGNLDINDPEL